MTTDRASSSPTPAASTPRWHRLDRRADRRRGHRGRGRRRPGRRGHRGDPQAGAGLRRGRGRGRRRRDEFADEYCLPALKANALYMDRYPLVSALSRPVIVKHLARPRRRARRRRSSRTAAPARATTRSGSRSASPPWRPTSRCIAPVRDSGMTRDKAIAFAEESDLPIDVRPRSRRTRSTRTCGAARSRPASSRTSGTRRSRTSTPTPRTRPCRASRTRSCITFDAGVPVAIDGAPVTVLEAIERAEPARRRAGRRPHRHGRGPAGRHQEPRGLRGARRDRADHRAPASWRT